MEVILLDSKILLNKCDTFPKYIEFQINSVCNANCIICPYKTISHKYPHTYMSDELIEKLIVELDENRDKIERVIPYLNNEPSLDKRMVQILRRLKKNNHFIELSTNMSGFTNDISMTIIQEKLVNELRISLFGGDNDTYHKMMPGLDFKSIVNKIDNFCRINKRFGSPIDLKIVIILYPEIEMKAQIQLIKGLFPDIEIYTFGFLDRANNVKNLENNKVLDIKNYNDYLLQGCDLNRPFERLCILSNGKVILCSQDWDREVELGNVVSQSLYDIWNGDLFEKERSRIVGKLATPPELYL